MNQTMFLSLPGLDGPAMSLPIVYISLTVQRARMFVDSNSMKDATGVANHQDNHLRKKSRRAVSLG